MKPQLIVPAVLLCAAMSVQAADEMQHQHQHKTDQASSMQRNAVKSAGSQELHSSMMKGMDEMHRMKMTGDVDKDFSTMMIHHHEQAIAMSKAVLEHGKNAEVKKKAREIIQESEKDIAELKKHSSQQHAADH